MDILLKPQVLQKTVHQIDQIHDPDDYEKKQGRAKHHSHFHEFAANQASLLVSTKHPIENEPYGTKSSAACEKKSDEAEQPKRTSPGNHVGDEVIEEIA